MKKYTNIALCPECGKITERRCCNKDLILYESKHQSFIDSIIPLIEGIKTCSDRLETT